MSEAARQIAEVVDIKSLGKSLEMISDEEVVLDHELATWLLNQAEQFVADRALRPAHVEYLMREMERETFIGSLVTLIVCEFDGKVYRMNGQHTCWAVVNLEDSIPQTHKVRLQKWKAASEHDLRRFYASIDRGSPRTKGNVISSYLIGTTEFGEFNAQMLSTLGSGLSFWLWPSSHDRQLHGGEDVAHLMQTEYLDLSIRVGNFLRTINRKDHKHLFRAPVVAAMFMTFKKAPKIAYEFWDMVGRGIGIDSEDDPRHRLRTFLTQVVLHSGKSGKRPINAEEAVRVCLTAWNAHRSGKEIRFFKPGSYTKRPAVK